LKSLLKGVLPLIRFPLLTTQDFASKVVPFNLLSTEQCLALFTYIAATEKKTTGKDEKKPDLPPPLKMFSNVKRKGAGKFLVRFDPSTARNCEVEHEGKSVTRLSSYESSVRGDKPLEDDAYLEVSLSADPSWSGSFVFGVIPQSVTVSPTCFTSEAWYFDMWHCHTRSLASTTDITALRGTELQKQFSDNCEGRIMGMRFTANPGGGGRLEWYLDGKPIDGANLVIPSSYKHSELIPFFGIYGRCRAARALE